MDPVCHTLVGAALGEAGLKRRTALGMATLLIGANFPDLDIVAMAFDRGLELRRGWTHGVLALVLLPPFLTGLMLGWDRLVRRRRGRRPRDAVRPGQILFLSYIAIWTHPTLDYLNTYGMRWLMPFRDRWFYGDAVFIVDPWMWLALAAGVILARRWGRKRAAPAPRPARWALGAVAAYSTLMLAGSRLGEHTVARELSRLGFDPQARRMVSPLPVNSLRRDVVFEDGPYYRFGTLTLLPLPRFRLDEQVVARGTDDPAAATAAATREGQVFLHWARFPFFVVERHPEVTLVRIADARYTTAAGATFGAVTISLPPEGD